MDPRNRADETLARARARGAFVVTPDNATSPMDASTTVRIPRSVVNGSDRDTRDPDSTMAIPQRERQHETPIGAWPQTDYGQAPAQQDLPPNPYQQQRGPGEFGPLGSQAAQQFPPR